MTEKEREKKERIKFQKRFGEHLKKVRRSKGLTMSEFARICYMESSNIARLEAGRINPSLFVLKKLTTGLEIKLSELLEGFE
jgi:transcriptional regulator with XRE-family HTH domain